MLGYITVTRTQMSIKSSEKFNRLSTTFVPAQTRNKRFIKVIYHNIFTQIDRIYKRKQKQNMNPYFTSRNTVKNLPANTKNKLESEQRWGIYKIGFGEGNKSYVG